DIVSAWMYFKVLREPEKVGQALEALPDEIEDYEQLERLIQVALHQGANPVKGIRLMLKGHGLCNTITTLDQILSQFTQAQRAESARILVRTIYDELCESLRHHIQ